ncbi:MAG TPA: diguanylate phosphodiesterase, partial [Aquifex aeolicus]|nr:diguanylate phosphodiesterase [Aquifex aeolicus]
EEEVIRRSLLRASLAQELMKLYVPSLEEKAYIVGLFSLTSELMGEHPHDIARELKLDEDIVEAYESRYNELGLVLSLVEVLEESADDEEMVKKVAKVLNTDMSKVKEAIHNARRITERITETTL